MKKLPSTISEIFDAVDKEGIVVYTAKGITPADAGLEYLGEILGGFGEHWIVDKSRIVFIDRAYKFMVSIDLKETDTGFEYTCSNAKYDVKNIEYLINQYSFAKYEITNVVGGRDSNGELYILEVDKDRFIHDPSDFNRLGYILKYRL